MVGPSSGPDRLEAALAHMEKVQKEMPELIKSLFSQFKNEMKEENKSSSLKAGEESAPPQCIPDPGPIQKPLEVGANPLNCAKLGPSCEHLASSSPPSLVRFKIEGLSLLF